MRTPTTDQIAIQLANGLTVRGSYHMSITGVHFDLYVMNSDAMVISSRNFAVTKCFHPQGTLITLVDALASLLTRYKIDKLVEPRIIERAVPVIVKAFRKDIALRNTAA